MISSLSKGLSCVALIFIFWSCGGDTEPEAIDCANAGLVVSVVSSTDTSCGASGGMIEVAASGGYGGYKYQINDSEFQTNGIFNGLGPGKYIVSVTDSEGCLVSVDAQLYSGISFAESIQPIIETNCAISGCHDGSGNVDYRVFQNLKNNPTDIKSRTQSGDMPRNGTLTQMEIDMIACWVDDGALNN